MKSTIALRAMLTMKPKTALRKERIMRFFKRKSKKKSRIVRLLLEVDDRRVARVLDVKKFWLTADS